MAPAEAPPRVGFVTAETFLDADRASLELLDDVGIDHVGTIDHVCFRGGQGVDGLVNAALLAGVSRTLPVHLGVYLLPLRHPVVVARGLATLASFAEGRIVFGVGIGGEDPHELESCGIDPRGRGRRTDEALMIVRRLLDGETVDHRGSCFELHDVRIRPSPRDRVPFLVGGRSDAAARRAGRFGDGWIGVFNSPDRFATMVKSTESAAVEHGRRVPRWTHAMEIWCGFDTTPTRARERLAARVEPFYGLPFDSFARYCPTGDPATVARALAEYVDAGCTTFNLISVAHDLDAALEATAEVGRLLGSEA